MPGKYPTINAPLTTRTTLTAGGTPGLSNSDKATLSLMFPNSPIYNLTEADYRAQAQNYLLPETQSGDPAQFPSVSMDYAGSPDLKTPPPGFDSSYYPNLIVNPDPAGGEGTATGTPLSPNDNFGTGATVDAVLPVDTAAIISKTTIAVGGPIAPLGQSGANLETGSVSTHTINEGAFTPTS